MHYNRNNSYQQTWTKKQNSLQCGNRYIAFELWNSVNVLTNRLKIFLCHKYRYKIIQVLGKGKRAKRRITFKSFGHIPSLSNWCKLLRSKCRRYYMLWRIDLLLQQCTDAEVLRAKVSSYAKVHDQASTPSDLSVFNYSWLKLLVLFVTLMWMKYFCNFPAWNGSPKIQKEMLI